MVPAIFEKDSLRILEKVYRAAAEKNLPLATFKYPSELLRPGWEDVNFDRNDVTCLRSCLTKPDHRDWIKDT